nr:uncharacterized protein LOC109191529 [Ipomoea trifida]
MQVFYADRVVLYRRSVPRNLPAFRSWTFKLLLKREEDEIKSGGFGYGHIDSALQLENAPPEEGGPSIPQVDVPHQPQPHEESPMGHFGPSSWQCGALFLWLCRSVSRSLPAFRSWKFKLLLKREQDEIKSGGFGYGTVPLAAGKCST